ncbi:MAG TPA: DUF309 domain-containing protein [Candidatus Binatia bacterium]|nr:DUF309 domain-containing protein [Candidatus Binatia bacterium]
MIRYSATSFPPYRYLPGRGPHPTRDPEGHSYGRQLPPVIVDDQTWPRCQTYLFAVDLFNHGYYWEAHEQLEAIWHGVGPDTPIGIFAQAVIQAAAALLKSSMGQAGAARRLTSAACEKLRGGVATVLGVDTAELARQLEEYVDGGAPAVPLIVLRREGGCASGT